MIQIVFLFIFTFSLSAMEHKSELAIRYINYDKYSNETIFQGNTRLKLQNDSFTMDATLEYLYSDKYNERKFGTINELFISKDYEDYSFTFGKIIKYWGELEGFNLADVYNQKNYLLNPFDKSAKLGSIGFNLTRYFNDNSLEIGVRLYEENLKYQSIGSPYYPFTIKYDENLELSDEKYRPTLHIVYDYISDESLDSETKLILIHGYDNKRYFIPINQTTLVQYAYRVNKFLLLSNIVYQDTVFKYEVSYTDVIDEKKISDYTQLSFGIEKSFYYEANIDIGVYLEYYKYVYMQDAKIEDVDISEIYNSDMFLALKIDFNDVRSSEIKGGFLYDTDNEEQVFKIEFKSRVIDNFVLNGEFLQIVSKDNTLLSNIGESRRVIVGLTYIF